MAIHEAGHAVAAAACDRLTLGDLLIVGRGDSAGLARVSVSAPGPVSAAVLDTLLTALLAGRAAEEVLLADISEGAGGGAGSDLARATQIATTAELSLGVGGQGSIWYPRLSPEDLVPLFARRSDIEQAVQRRLDATYARARKMVEANAPKVRMLAERLLAYKAMSADEVTALLGSVRTRSGGPIPPPASSKGGTAPSIH